MGIQNLSILEGATLSATGGVAVNFVPDGQSVVNGVHVVNSAETDFRIRENATFKYKPPALQADGEYSKAKNTALYVQPKILASGKTVFNLVEIRTEIHPEVSAADAAILRGQGAQLLFDSDVTSFWTVGNLA